MFKTVRPWPGILATLSTAFVAAGCGFTETCELPEELANTTEVPGLVVPEGLDQLDPNRALDIPIATSPPRDEDADCIDKPPNLRDSG